MRHLHRALTLGIGLIVASPACTVEYGSMGNNGPNADGMGGAPPGRPVTGGGGNTSTDYPSSLGGNMALAPCFCDEALRGQFFVDCPDGPAMGPACALQPDDSCEWVPQPCPDLQGGGGTTGTGPFPSSGGTPPGTAVTGSGGMPPGTPVSGGTTSTDPGTPVSGGTTSIDPGTAITGSGGTPPGTPVSGGTTSTSACPAVTLSVPSCGAGALTILYDTAGCIAGFVCLVN